MKNINTNAPVVCSKSILINATPQKVWQVLTSINQWSTWQTEIQYAHLNGELQPESTFDWKTGGAKIHSTLHTVETFKSFGWTGKTMGLFAIHNWTLKEDSGVTIVKVDESMEGLLAKIFKKTFNKSLEKGMLTWLELLKKVCEEKL